jgi:uncharacterized protein YjbJ (UPF0337 family)
MHLNDKDGPGSLRSLSNRRHPGSPSGWMSAAISTRVALAHPRDHKLELIMNKDQKAGRVKEVKGTVKEVAGRITGDKTLENKGKVENKVGQAQSAFGDAKADLAKALKK